jgi:hypothetical protein
VTLTHLTHYSDSSTHNTVVDIRHFCSTHSGYGDVEPGSRLSVTYVGLEPAGKCGHPIGPRQWRFQVATLPSFDALNTQARYLCVLAHSSKQAASRQYNQAQNAITDRAQAANRTAAFKYRFQASVRNAEMHPAHRNRVL